MRWLHSAGLASDASRVAYSVSEHDAVRDQDVTNVWIADIGSGEHRQLTFGTSSDSKPSWSPDGERLAIVSDRVDDTAQIFLLDPSSGDATQLTDLANGVGGSLAWSPDGTRLAFTAGHDGPPEDPAAPYRVTRNVYRFDGLGYVHRLVNDVCVVAVETGQVSRLTDNDAVNGSVEWAPDGSRLLFQRSLDAETFLGARPNVAIVDLGGNETTVVSNAEFAVKSATWHSDGERIVFAATPRSKPNGCKADLYVMAPGAAPANRTASLPMGVCGVLQGDMPSGIDLSASRIVVAPDGNSAWCEVQRGGRVEIARIALAGAESIEPVLDGDRTLRLVDAQPEVGTILFSAADINRPIDLFVSDLGGATEQPITAVNEGLAGELNEATIRRLTFTGADGTPVEGWHVAPDDKAKVWPTLLSIHGGPHLGFGHNYRFDTHMLLGAGYAVLLINHRASSGYDDEFGTINGEWGTHDCGDLMLGVDEAVSQGLADADRLGVFGLSGGGYLSCWIVGQTDRFKAAVPENPITNWVSSYGVGDASVWLAVDELGGHPHEIPEEYTRCSPITHAHKCTTPTLLVQGEHDWRCTAEQSEQFYTVLKVNGCEAEMLRLPGSSHIGAIAGPPVIRRAKNEAMLDWFVRHV